MSVPRLMGIDFSSRPTLKKPITVAHGRIANLRGKQAVCLEKLEKISTLEGFEDFLLTPGPWLAGFDFPFALPTEFLAQADWPHSSWQAHMQHIGTLQRAEMVEAFRKFCDARPVGNKFAHRATDLLAGSSPSMKWVNPPVAYMLHAGAPALLRAGVHVPLLHEGDRGRIALEAYPGYFARSIVARASYKSDDLRKQTSERKEQRRRIVCAIEDSRNMLNLLGKFDAQLRAECIDDASGDTLDACICLMQTAWGALRADENFGLPEQTELIYALEGWIVSVQIAMNKSSS